MRKMTTRTFVGMVFWVLLIGISVWAANRLSRNSTFLDGAGRLTTYWTANQPVHQVELTQAFEYEFRDPIFRKNKNGKLVRIGEISSPSESMAKKGSLVNVKLYSDRYTDWDQGKLEIHNPPADMARVAEVLFTPERNNRLGKIWRLAKTKHEKEIVRILEPIFRDALKELNPIIQTELNKSLAKHQPQIQKIAEKYRRQIVQQKLIPLIKTEVFPVVKQESEPLIEEIGEKLWKRVSLGSFAWRAVYDGIVGPSDSLVSAEWDRFLREDAFPTLETHTEDFIQVQGNIAKRLAKNTKVRKVLIESVKQVAGDPEFQQLAGDILRHTLTENPTVKQRLKEILSDQKTKTAFRKVGNRVEPETTDFGKEVFGTPEKITKEFALVLRQMVLKKDRRWFVWTPAEASPSRKPNSPKVIQVVPAKRLTEPPFYYPPE